MRYKLLGKSGLRVSNEEGFAMPVTLINVFSVPNSKEDEFVKWWQDVKGTITTQPDS